MSRWLAVVVVMVVVLTKARAEKNAEELPKVSAWRQRPSSSSSSSSLGSNPSYDLSEAFNAMAANRMGSGFGGAGGSSRGTPTPRAAPVVLTTLLKGVAVITMIPTPPQRDMEVTVVRAATALHRLSCASGYVNASAVALLAFLFLLNIVQDVVQQITGARKRRSVDQEEQEDVFAFVSNGGLGAMKEGLPQVVLPLMIDLLDAAEAPHECLQRPLCEANAELSTRFGVAGRMVGSLLSNVVSKAFSGDHLPKFHLGLQASSAGRSGHDCSATFRKCSLGHQYSQEANESHRRDQATPQQDQHQGPLHNFLS
ncbi:hypothetical protein GWK47_039428 [Chionoecetes opilio]|uniref:Secreted protein n=1 Tax=Chionoecetes opilio TaxID=41210 RepID=A0A8J4YK58_CHIOP|nr:hypothetical protein GWK47_039428 [Chionoecetes opilio]